MIHDNFHIEMLLKIKNKEHSLFNNCDKIIDTLNFNDKLNIYQDDTRYKIQTGENVFAFSIIMEPCESVFSINITAEMDVYDQLTLTGILDSLTNIVREIKVTISENFKNCSYEILCMT